MLYIKDGNNFKTKWYGEYTSYSNLPFGSDDNSSGNVVVPYRLENIVQGDILIIGETAWFIDSASADTSLDKTTITVKDLLNVFRYTYPSNFGSYADAKQYVYNIMRYHYTEQPDTYYKLSYISATKSSESAIKPIEPDYSEDTLALDSDYIRKCCIGDLWTKGIHIDTSYDTNHLNFHITNRIDTPANIVFSDKEHELISREFDKESISKVTVYVNATYKNGNSEVSFVDGGSNGLTYYLKPNGTEVQRDTAPTGYVKGKWVTRMENQSPSIFDKTKGYDAGSLVVNTSLGNFVYRSKTKINPNTEWTYDNWMRYAEYVAYKEISSNVDSYKVEFKSSIKYDWQQRVNMRFEDGRLFSGIITSVSISSDDNRYTYRVGNLPVKATEVIKKKLENKKVNINQTTINSMNTYNGVQVQPIPNSSIDSIVG